MNQPGRARPGSVAYEKRNVDCFPAVLVKWYSSSENFPVSVNSFSNAERSGWDVQRRHPPFRKNRSSEQPDALTKPPSHPEETDLLKASGVFRTGRNISLASAKGRSLAFSHCRRALSE